MQIHMKTKTSGLLAALLAVAAVAPGFAASAPPPASAGPVATAPGPRASVSSPGLLADMLPLAWQKRPKVQFNVITEMSPAGRLKRVPTPANPLYYHYTAIGGQFVEAGDQVTAGEKPPPQVELERALREALATSGYLPANERQRPDVLIVFSYGSHGAEAGGFGPDNALETTFEPATATELVNAVIRDPRRMNDVVERARLVAGDRIAFDLKTALEGEVLNRVFNRTYARHVEMVGGPLEFLPINPAADSPFQMFLHGSRSPEDLLRPLAETIFHGCYFVSAIAFDFDGVAHQQRVPLWRTKMTVASQGVSLEEVLRPLIATTGPYLGRDMTEPAVVNRRIDRAGNVELGTPSVVPGGTIPPVQPPKK